MDLMVLGPLEAVENGQPLPLGGLKQRTVLALLIANRGRPVSADALIDGVYGEDAPSGARRSVQTYVSNLRGQIGDVIRSTGSGYTLDPEMVTIDAATFEKLVEDEENGDPTIVAQRLRDALAMWRGLPYADVDGFGAIPSEVTRLSELRLVAVERKVNADLAAGRHAEVVGELESLTTEYPFRESFQGQYMLALYRSGRQAEALRAFEKARLYLVEEMGLDPSPELRDLGQKILEQDSSLGYQPAPTIQRAAALVADIEDPASLVGTDPGDRVRIVDEHTNAINAAIEAHEGHAFAQRGTAIYAWFDSVVAAVDAAEQAQWSLAELDDRQPCGRIAIDFGDMERVGGDAVQGPPVGRAAALLARARGGHVLLAPGAHTELTARGGEWQIRGLGTAPIDGAEQEVPVHLLHGGWPMGDASLRDIAIAPAPPDPSRAIPGYEWREKVGEGVLGVVHRAYQPSVGIEVAIKRIRSELANHPLFIRRFEVEAQLVARLEHPHIVPLYDFWRDGEGAFLVMRWMRGGSLEQRLRRGSMGLVETSKLLSQVGAALAVAHRRGVVHRGIREGNVLADEEGNWYLSDFGVAVMDPPTDGKEKDLADLGKILVSCIGPAEEGAVAVAESAAKGRYAEVEALLADWHAATGGSRSVETPERTDVRNPYKGLNAFTELDADDFHGRDALVGQLVSTAADRRLTAVVGPSGIGKSSVVRSGLIPAVRQGAIPGSENWLVTDMIPTRYPYEQLASALERVATRAPSDLEERLRADHRGLLRATQRYLPQNTTLLLVVDQFEELFTIVADEDERSAFLDLLSETATDAHSSVRIVLTIRADFFDQPLRYASFGKLLRSGTVNASAPTNEELREIIAQPAAGVGVGFESGLVDRIVGEIGDQPGTLPLLEFALTRLFEHRSADLITSGDYDRVGGVLAALGRRAEQVFGQFDDAQRDVARQVFLRLVNVSESGRATRRRTRMTELNRLGYSPSELKAVVDPLVESRLLTLDRDAITRGPTIEVAHEALLSEWSRLAEWIEAQQEDLLLHSRLAVAVADWEASERSERYLLQGGRLEQHEAWAFDTELTLTTAEREFLELSRTAEDERRAQRRRVRRRVLAGFGIAAVVASVLAVAALNTSRQARANEVVAEGRALLASASAIDDDPQLALLLSLEAADRLGDVPAATAALHRSIEAERTIYEATLSAELGHSSLNGDLSPDGSLLAVASSDSNVVELHDIEGGAVLWRYEFPLASPTDYEVSAKFAGDGSQLLVGVGWYPESSQPGVAPSAEVGYHLFDVSTGGLIRRLDSGPCGPMVEEFAIRESSDRYAASVGFSQSWFDQFGCGWPEEGAPFLDALRVDVETNEVVPIARDWDLDEAPFLAGMSADGRRAIIRSVAEDQFAVVDIVGGETIQSFEAPFTNTLFTLSPDGTTATGPGTLGLGLYDVETGTLLGNLPPPDSETGLMGAGWTDDGTQVFLSNIVGEVVLYDAATGVAILTVPASGAAAELVRVARDGDLLATFELEAGVTLGQPAVRVSKALPEEAGRFAPCDESMGPFYLVDGVEIHEDLITVFALCEGGAKPSRAFTYDYETGVLLAEHPAVYQDIDIADRSLAAMQTWIENGDTWMAGDVTVVNLRSGEVVETLSGVCNWEWSASFRPDECITGSGIPLRNSELAISPDASVVAIASNSNVGLAWNRSTGTMAQLGRPESDIDGSVYLVAVSGDGTHLAAVQQVRVAGEEDGTRLLLYSTEDFTLLDEVVYRQLWLAPSGIRFSPDGRKIVGNTGKSVVFFDALTLEQIALVQDADSLELRNIAFNSDGSLIATTGLDRVARVWDADSLTLVHEIEVGTQGSGVRFASDDRQLAVLTRQDGVQLFHLELDALLAEARSRLRRGFTEAECDVYFPVDPCPTLEEMLAGD